MVFSSPIFLFAFLPFTCLLALLSRKNIKVQNLLLAIMSVIFYTWGNPALVALLLVSVIANYFLARLVETRRSGDINDGNDSGNGAGAGDDIGVDSNLSNNTDAGDGSCERGCIGKNNGKIGEGKLEKYRKSILVACVIFNILLLCVFKYTNFIVENINRIPGVSLPDPGIPLPIGISFFTFQAMSYVLDVGSGRLKAQRSIIAVLFYVSFFPQLIAGPIVRYGDIEPNLAKRSPTLEDAAYGLRRFVFGLSKKLLIANSIGAVADAVFGVTAQAASFGAIGVGGGPGGIGGIGGVGGASAGASGALASSGLMGVLTCPVAWIGAIAYTLQIYYDFSGYSDMAIGLGRMFGFRYLENFDYPYSSLGLRDFWRKWHISLSTWFRDYVYIPLGGNRRGKLREVINKITIFFLTGLWHGANWTFIVWGLFHGLFLTLESYGVLRPRKMPKIAAWLYTMLVVIIGFVIFRAHTLADAGHILSAMFFGAGSSAGAGIAFVNAGAGISAGAAAGGTLQFSQLLTFFKPSTLIATAAALVAMFPFKAALESRTPKLQPIGFLLSLPLFLLCILNLATATYNPFIYYRF